MKLKESPEDFLVDEIPIDFPGSGEYTVVRVQKRLMNTEDAAYIIAKQFGLPRKLVGYAGAKDKVAVTTQYFSLKGVSEEKINGFTHEDIEIEFVNKHNQPLSLGDLHGNKFTIIARELKKPLAQKKQIRNYFGPQRFGDNNVDVGRLLVKKQFKEACELLDLPADNPIKSLRSLPKHTLTLYVHAYQSWMWNKVLESFEEVPDSLPLIGFGTDLDDYEKTIKEKYEELLEQEGITARSFIIKQIPGLSSEGDVRKTTIVIEDLELGPFKDGVQKASFTLPKGSYATVVMEELAC